MKEYCIDFKVYGSYWVDAENETEAKEKFKGLARMEVLDDADMGEIEITGIEEEED